MDLSRLVSQINGDFSRKSQNFLRPVYFAIGYRRSASKKLEWWATTPRKKFDDIR